MGPTKERGPKRTTASTGGGGLTNKSCMSDSSLLSPPPNHSPQSISQWTARLDWCSWTTCWWCKTRTRLQSDCYSGPLNGKTGPSGERAAPQFGFFVQLAPALCRSCTAQVPEAWRVPEARERENQCNSANVQWRRRRTTNYKIKTLSTRIHRSGCRLTGRQHTIHNIQWLIVQQ